MGTTAVPRRIAGTETAATASAVSASSPAVCGNQIDGKPSLAAALHPRHHVVDRGGVGAAPDRDGDHDGSTGMRRAGIG